MLRRGLSFAQTGAVKTQNDKSKLYLREFEDLINNGYRFVDAKNGAITTVLNPRKAYNIFVTSIMTIEDEGYYKMLHPKEAPNTSSSKPDELRLYFSEKKQTPKPSAPITHEVIDLTTNQEKPAPSNTTTTAGGNQPPEVIDLTTPAGSNTTQTAESWDEVRRLSNRKPPANRR